MRVYLANKTPLALESAPLNSGGQGAVYRFDARVHPALRLRLAKLPKPHSLSPDYEARIQYMCAHRPPMANLPSPDALAWPEHCLYDASGDFIGFTLPYIGGARELEILCTPQATSDPRFAKYCGLSPASRHQRFRVARSLVDALAALEAAGDYVCTDLKPQNAMVKPTGEVSVIDLDNLQIREQGQVLFPASGITSEYPPPEYYQGKVDLANDQIDKSFERFTMAVILYRLLFGIHPFMAISDASDILDAIRRGYFVHGRHARRIQIVPPPHQEFLNEDPALQQLFQFAFDDGTQAAQRPSASQWAALLAQLGARPIPVSPRHARAAWAAQHGIPLPTTTVFKGWERASAWNPHPPRRKGYRSTDLLVDPAISETIDAEDPLTGVRMHAEVYPIWLIYAFDPVVVGKRVILSFRVPPRLVARANFTGGGRLGRAVPPAGGCVRDIYDTFVFRLRYFPRAARLLSRERWQQGRVALKVDVPQHDPRDPVARIEPRPLTARIAAMTHPVARPPVAGAALAGVVSKSPRAAAGLSGYVAARAVQTLRRPGEARPAPPGPTPPSSDAASTGPPRAGD